MTRPLLRPRDAVSTDREPETSRDRGYRRSPPLLRAYPHRANVVGIFPNEASILRLIGAVLFERNDEWQTSSRYMMVEVFARIDKEEIDTILSMTTKAA